MHSNRARINETVEICMELFFRTIVIRWELFNSSNTFAANLNVHERHQFFILLTLYKSNLKPITGHVFR